MHVQVICSNMTSIVKHFGDQEWEIGKATKTWDEFEPLNFLEGW